MQRGEVEVAYAPAIFRADPQIVVVDQHRHVIARQVDVGLEDVGTIRQPAGAHHLGDGHTGAVVATKDTERTIRHTGQRSQNRVAIDIETTDLGGPPALLFP